MANTIYARNTITGVEREFSELVFKELINTVDSRGVVIPFGGWVKASRPTEKPTAAIEAEKRAAEKAAAEQAKADAIAKREAELIGNVEAKIVQESAKIDFRTELKPYMDAKGLTDELGKLPQNELIIKLRERLVK